MDNIVVLLVESDPDDRDRYGTWLEAEGMEVIACPGPSGPEYTCLGSRTGACPLASKADAVILDAALPGDVFAEGASASDLVTLYTSLGKPVIGLATLARDVPPPAGFLRWPPTEKELVAAVRDRVGPSPPAPGRRAQVRSLGGQGVT
jgi:hypothetical protein